VHEVERQGRVARVFEIEASSPDGTVDDRLPTLAHAADGSPVPKDDETKD
jgi:hypothetical protein